MRIFVALVSMMTMTCASARSAAEHDLQANIARHLTIGGISAGTSTTREVREVFGPAPVARESNSVESPLVLCYFDASAQTLAKFVAGSAGAWREINVIRIERFSSSQPGCATGSFGNLATTGGLSLGLDQSQVFELLGRANVDALGHAEYRVSRKIGNADLVVGINIDFHDGVVVAFEVYSTKTT